MCARRAHPARTAPSACLPQIILATTSSCSKERVFRRRNCKRLALSSMPHFPARGTSRSHFFQRGNELRNGLRPPVITVKLRHVRRRLDRPFAALKEERLRSQLWIVHRSPATASVGRSKCSGFALSFPGRYYLMSPSEIERGHGHFLGI